MLINCNSKLNLSLLNYQTNYPILTLVNFKYLSKSQFFECPPMELLQEVNLHHHLLHQTLILIIIN